MNPTTVYKYTGTRPLGDSDTYTLFHLGDIVRSGHQLAGIGRVALTLQNSAPGILYSEWRERGSETWRQWWSRDMLATQDDRRWSRPFNVGELSDVRWLWKNGGTEQSTFAAELACLEGDIGPTDESYLIFNAEAGEGDPTSIPVDLTGPGTSCSVQLVWTGDLTGSDWTFSGSNNHDAVAGTGDWTTFTLSTDASDPAGSASSTWVDFTGLSWEKVRIAYANSSGTGNITGYAKRRWET